ncbi:unnamed protein product, partial [Discosporangium mesarthrocarpum]
MIGKLVIAVRGISREFCQWFLRFLTGKGELQRICSNAASDSQLTGRVARALSQSYQLHNTSKVLFGSSPFSVKDMVGTIARVESVSEDEISKLGWCLQVMSSVNQLHRRVKTLRCESFNADSPSHGDLLDRLWIALKPGMRRTGPSDWGEIGFQNGAKPESDFRSMGMLGLHQLVHFAERQTKEARDILTESCNPRRYFPFVAAGVNISAYVVGLLEQRRLDFRLYGVI